MKCKYCGNKISKKFPNREIHNLCKILRSIAEGRNLTSANDDGYPMLYVKSIEEKFPNLKTNSDHYVYVHEVIPRLILGRDLISQGDDNSEVVDHRDGNKKNFSPHNLRVMNLKEHVKSHKKKDFIDNGRL